MWNCLLKKSSNVLAKNFLSLLIKRIFYFISPLFSILSNYSGSIVQSKNGNWKIGRSRIEHLLFNWRNKIGPIHGQSQVIISHFFFINLKLIETNVNRISKIIFGMDSNYKAISKILSVLSKILSKKLYNIGWLSIFHLRTTLLSKNRFLNSFFYRNFSEIWSLRLSS